MEITYYQRKIGQNPGEDGALEVTITNGLKKAKLLIRQYTDDLDGKPDIYFNAHGEIIFTCNNGEADYEDRSQHASQHNGFFTKDRINEVIAALEW